MATRFLAVAAVLFIAACDSTAAPEAFPVPVAVSAQPHQGSIVLMWHEPAGATVSKYQIEYSNDAVSWQTLKETTDLTVTHASVQYQKRYYYRVRACDGTNCSEWVNVNAIWDGGVAPFLGKPGVGSIGLNYATVVFNLGNGGLTTYATVYVKRGDDIVFRSSPFQYDVADGLEGSRIFTLNVFGLMENTAYTVFAVASNQAGEAASLENAFTTAKPGIPTIRDFRNDATSRNVFTLRASIDPGGVDANAWFELERVDQPFSEASKLDGLAMTPMNGVISKPEITNLTRGTGVLPAGSTYKARVVAENQFGRAVSDSVVFQTVN